MQDDVSGKTYKLHAADGTTYLSSSPGTLGGYKPLRIYGRLDCYSANAHLKKGHYANSRVFFADEATAIAAGFRPCGNCLRIEYARWKAGGQIGTADYPWRSLPRGLADDREDVAREALVPDAAKVKQSDMMSILARVQNVPADANDQL